MKRLVFCVVVASLASPVIAATRLDRSGHDEAGAQARSEQALKHLYDHPMTRVIANPNLQVTITRDTIMRSCCRPPDLIVSGRALNRSPHPVDYIRFIFSFEDKDGKVVYAESVYNSRAASMGADAEVQRVLKEKPHFTPIASGQSDTFAMSIPLTLLPNFAQVELYSNDTAAARSE